MIIGVLIIRTRGWIEVKEWIKVKCADKHKKLINKEENIIYSINIITIINKQLKVVAYKKIIIMRKG